MRPRGQSNANGVYEPAMKTKIIEWSSRRAHNRLAALFHGKRRARSPRTSRRALPRTPRRERRERRPARTTSIARGHGGEERPLVEEPRRGGVEAEAPSGPLSARTLHLTGARSRERAPPRLHSPGGPLAQLVEQGTFNPKVAGSNPARPIFLSSTSRFSGRTRSRCAYGGSTKPPVRCSVGCMRRDDAAKLFDFLVAEFPDLEITLRAGAKATTDDTHTPSRSLRPTLGLSELERLVSLIHHPGERIPGLVEHEGRLDMARRGRRRSLCIVVTTRNVEDAVDGITE